MTAGDADVQSVVDRLMASQVRYEPAEDRAAVQGDRVEMDFVGYIDDEAFEGGKGENVALVLGEGRFIPGFEDGLMGAKAGEQRQVEVSFPADYQAENLAGKPARFEVTVRTVAAGVPPKDEDDLATLVDFADGAALRADIRRRLEAEAKDAGHAATRQVALDALLAANAVELPEALLREDVRPRWRLDRDPYLLETSMSGVFVAGDVRSDSMKRVASAVGEGSMAVHFVHEYLAAAG